MKQQSQLNFEYCEIIFEDYLKTLKSLFKLKLQKLKTYNPNMDMATTQIWIPPSRLRLRKIMKLPLLVVVHLIFTRITLGNCDMGIECSGLSHVGGAADL